MKGLAFFLMALVLSGFLNFILVVWAKKKPKFFFRIGGIAIISSFVISILIIPEIVISLELRAILIGSIAILFFGFWDDYKSFNWKIQILFQLFLALILIWFGFEIDLISFSGRELLRLDFWNFVVFGNYFSVISSLFIVFWLMGIINAVNWLDGSDGLLSIAGILSLLAVFFVSLRPEVNQPALAIISLVGIGSFLGFFIFNFPLAKIEAGTSGSYFGGFLLASLAIMAGTKIATTMVVLILPVMDFGWVIIERLKEGQSIFKRDDKKRHLHYKLLKQGFSQKQILLGYGIFLSLALLVSFFVVNQTQKIILLGTEFIMILFFMISLSRKNIFKKMQMNFKKILLNPLWVIIFVAVGLIFFSFQQRKENRNNLQLNAQIEINQKKISSVQIVQTPEEVYRGLSEVEFLPRENGMLFIYNKLSSSPHVMRDMNFDLDFIFLRDGKIVFLKEKVSKNFEGVIESPIPCNQVLEVKAGEINRLKIKVGDQIEIKKGNYSNF